MGMYDTFIATATCPYTGAEAVEMGFQTKEFRCELNDWRLGDAIGECEPLTIVEGSVVALGSCKCPKCAEIQPHGGRLVVGIMLIKDSKFHSVGRVVTNEEAAREFLIY